MNGITEIRIRFFFILALLALLIFAPAHAFAKAKVAILPWKVNAADNADFLKDAMSDMLSSRVGSGESAEVLRSDVVKSALSGAKPVDITDSSALDAGKKLKADYVLYGSLTILGSTVSLDAKFVNVKDGAITSFYNKGAGMDSIIGLADKLSADVASVLSPAPPQALKAAQAPVAEKPQAAFIVPAPAPVPVPAVEPVKDKDNDFIVRPKEGAVKPVLWKSALIDGQFIAFAAADVPKDGAKKLFLVKTTGVVIAKIAGKKLDVLKEIPAESGVKNVAITAIDADGDGAPEIYVSAIKENKPYTSVIEFKDNDYKVTATGVKWLVRAVNYKNSRLLIGQAFRRPDGFYGPIHVLKKQGSEVVEAGAFDITLPKKLDVYRFEVFQSVADSVAETMLVTLDARNYLKLYRAEKDGKWEEVLKSTDYFGGTLNYIEYTEEDRPVTVEQEPVAVEGGFYLVESKGGGKNSLIIKRNVPGGLGRYAKIVRSFTSGYVLNLSMNESDGGFLNENWRTKEVAGYMADFFIDDLSGDGTQKLYMLMVEGAGLFSGSIKSYILSSKVSL